MSCECQICGRQYRVDVLIPDELWQDIHPKDGGLLCGSCIMEKIESRGLYDAFTLLYIKEKDK